MKDERVPGAMYVALAAPWGVGKTSVIGALLEEATGVLAGTPVSVEATGPTSKRLNQLTNEIRGHLRAREFVPGGIRGTQEVAEFSLAVRAVGTDREFRVEVLDYPGGVVDVQSGAQWAHVKQWLQDSEVLILPIDATLLMEAVTARQHNLAEELLNIAQMEVSVRTWAKHRVHAGHAPGLLVLAPVKCETYFADNGGVQDRSEALFQRVMEVYAPVLAGVRGEAAETEVLYCPIDTLGCVEVLRVEWPKDDGRPIPHYRVRGDPVLKRKGAADLFVKITDRMLSQAHGSQVDAVRHATETAEQKARYAEQSFGLVGNFWAWLSGERDRLRRLATGSRGQAAKEQEALEALVATLEEVRRRPLGARCKTPGR